MCENERIPQRHGGGGNRKRAQGRVWAPRHPRKEGCARKREARSLRNKHNVVAREDNNMDDARALEHFGKFISESRLAAQEHAERERAFRLGEGLVQLLFNRATECKKRSFERETCRFKHFYIRKRNFAANPLPPQIPCVVKVPSGIGLKIFWHCNGARDPHRIAVDKLRPYGSHYEHALMFTFRLYDHAHRALALVRVVNNRAGKHSSAIVGERALPCERRIT